MSMPPGIMQQLLMQRLQQPTGGMPTAGGGNAGPLMQGHISPTNAASQLMQKIMLMKALQNAPQTPGGATGGQQRQANAMLPQTNALMAQPNPQLQQRTNQSLAQNPMLQALQQPPPVADQSLQPIAGYS
jgi:hypothetical protein